MRALERVHNMNVGRKQRVLPSEAVGFQSFCNGQSWRKEGGGYHGYEICPGFHLGGGRKDKRSTKEHRMISIGQ